MQIRDWLYVMDHCKAIDMVANGGKDGEVYNLTNISALALEAEYGLWGHSGVVSMK